MEDYAIILDFLPQGRHDDKRFKREPVAYAVGTQELKLFELTPKDNVTLTVGDTVYIGKNVEERKEILHVKRRISHSDLTRAAMSELPFIIERIVDDREEDFLKFYNHARAITTRMHMLELLPGLGKKTMWAIIEEKRNGDFTSFEELKKRVPALHHPKKLIVKRIIQELEDPDQKYHLFVAK